MGLNTTSEHCEQEKKNLSVWLLTQTQVFPTDFILLWSGNSPVLWYSHQGCYTQMLPLNGNSACWIPNSLYLTVIWEDSCALIFPPRLLHTDMLPLNGNSALWLTTQTAEFSTHFIWLWSGKTPVLRYSHQGCYTQICSLSCVNSIILHGSALGRRFLQKERNAQDNMRAKDICICEKRNERAFTTMMGSCDKQNHRSVVVSRRGQNNHCHAHWTLQNWYTAYGNGLSC